VICSSGVPHSSGRPRVMAGAGVLRPRRTSTATSRSSRASPPPGPPPWCGGGTPIRSASCAQGDAGPWLALDEGEGKAKAVVAPLGAVGRVIQDEQDLHGVLLFATWSPDHTGEEGNAASM